MALSSGCYRFTRFELDLMRGCLREGDREIKLRPKSFLVLRHLVEQAGRLLSKDELMAAAWPDVHVSDGSLVQCIREIRRALDDDAQATIRTMPGRGYLFAAPVRFSDPAVGPSIALAPPTRRAIARRLGRLGVAVAVAACVGAAAAMLAVRWLDRAPPALNSVAVLPFEPLGGSDDVARQFTDDLQVVFARITDGVAVVRQTGPGYRPPADVTAIGRALNVRFVVEGSIRREAGQLRVAAKLDDAVTGSQVWAQVFDSDAAETASQWDELVRRIGTNTARALGVAAAERSWDEHRDDPSALDFEIRGRGLVLKGMERANLIAAREQFEQALRRDPDSLEAASWLADVGVGLVLDNWAEDRGGELARAEALNRRVLAGNPSKVQAQFTRATLLRARGAFEQSIAAYDRVIELDSLHSGAHAGIGRVMMNVGRFEDALPHLETALRLAPSAIAAGHWNFLMGVSQFYLGRDEAAARLIRKAIEVNPEQVIRRKWLVAACGSAGRLDEAEREAALVREQDPDFSVAGFMQTILASLPVDDRQRAHVRDGLRRAGVPD
jgi:DNA-binding winged helix-turn-helix (wHTH) protein/TolB-like protein/Tfp pilus assembly protein PilF